MKLPSLQFLTSLSFSILALPAIRCAVPPTFILVAHAPGTPLDGKPVNANGLAFWIGKPTRSYCPEEVLPLGACPPGNQTVVAIGDNPATPCSENAVCGSAGMYVEVPGGQQIYVDSSLALRITIPHSGAIPAGSSVSNFSLTDTGRFGWNAHDACRATFVACPQYQEPKVPTGNRTEGCEEEEGEVAYQIYGAKSEKAYPRNRFGRNRCVRNVTLQATPVEGLGAWEYI